MHGSGCKDMQLSEDWFPLKIRSSEKQRGKVVSDP